MILFLTAVGVLCLINIGLALLLMLADALITDDSDRVITINGSRTITVAGGGPLLTALKEQQIFIPSACGGRGSCGLCKVAVVEGGGQLLPTEIPWISAEEQKNHIRLSCQLKVRRDLSIRIPEELFNVRQYQAEVTAIEDLTHDIKQVSLKLADPATISFTAGQYIQIEVPPYALTDEPIYRAYSVASDSEDNGRVELEVRYVPNGICTTYVHKHLKIGDRLTFNGPYGEFGLRPTEREIICIAGGSGMAPIHAILLEMARTRNPRRCRYFFGARAKRDLFLIDEMRQLEKQIPNFRFIAALSAPEPDDHWEGETGLITEVVSRHVTDASQSEGYLCGSPLMIDACIAVLREKGMPEEHIYYDKFA